MKDNRALAPWIKRFLLEYLPGDRNFARNTQQSYRDALRLLVVFASDRSPRASTRPVQRGHPLSHAGSNMK